jgi:hypothetical protein
MAFDPLREMGKLLLLLGGVVFAVGLLLTIAPKLPFRLDRLPGDIIYTGKNTTFYFPIVTCLLLSAALTLVLWLVSFFRR